jgi:hypothetical protein
MHATGHTAGCLQLRYEDTPGDTLLTLKRKYKDEDITISVSDNLQVGG